MRVFVLPGMLVLCVCFARVQREVGGFPFITTFTFILAPVCSYFRSTVRSSTASAPVQPAIAAARELRLYVAPIHEGAMLFSRTSLIALRSPTPPTLSLDTGTAPGAGK